VAWRLGNMDECQENGLAALELWRPLSMSYPFCWTALLPLISVALAKQQVSEAVEYARMLLEPHQQRFPDDLTTALETAIQAWDTGQSDAARSHLQQATALAREMSYL
jgi:eukaryotic-like serine/threonine-protein kinase